MKDFFETFWNECFKEEMVLVYKSYTNDKMIVVISIMWVTNTKIMTTMILFCRVVKYA